MISYSYGRNGYKKLLRSFFRSQRLDPDRYLTYLHRLFSIKQNEDDKAMQFVSDNNLHIALVVEDNDLVQKVFRSENLSRHRGRGHDMLDNRLVSGSCEDARGKDFQLILSGIASDLYSVINDPKSAEASYDLAVALQGACHMHLSEFEKLHALPRAILVDIRDRSNPEVRIGLA